MNDFLGDRQCVTHHACDCFLAERDRLSAQHDALYLAVKEEVEHYRQLEQVLTVPEVADAAKTIADRLDAILAGAGEKREVPDYRADLESLIQSAAALYFRLKLGHDGRALEEGHKSLFECAEEISSRLDKDGAFARLSSEQKGGGSGGD